MRWNIIVECVGEDGKRSTITLGNHRTGRRQYDWSLRKLVEHASSDPLSLAWRSSRAFCEITIGNSTSTGSDRLSGRYVAVICPTCLSADGKQLLKVYVAKHGR